MRAGLLTRPITILTPETTINEFGEQVQEYKLKYKTRARVLHDSGSRDIMNGEIFYPYRKSFDVRSYVPVNEFDIIEFEGKRYRIIAIDNRIEHTNDKVIVTELINN
jgi:hypothetical protein